jgi:biotin synthase
VGPYLPHPDTPLGREFSGGGPRLGRQVPSTEEMVYKTIALTRLLCPRANIPSTTALATINTRNGRELGLMRGANVVMPNLTPARYRRHYEIYPNKACIAETPADCSGCLRGRIAAIGRVPGVGPGNRQRETAHV